MRKRLVFSPDVAATVAGLLTEYRRRKGLNQKEIQQITDVSHQVISALETGFRTDSIRLVQVWKLLTAYGVTLAQFETDITASLKRRHSG